MNKEPEAKTTEIVAAIVNAIGSLGRLSKESFNQFDKYKFTSIDDFLVATGRVCAENGLVVIQDEISREVLEKANRSGGVASWLSFEFRFLVLHTSGESLGPLSRTVAVPFTGAQSFGSGQSYALKQFMRSLFQIATGDQDDADYGPQTNTPPVIGSTEPPPASIQDETRDLIYELADLMDAFPNRDVFDSFVLEWTKRTVAGMSDELGRKVFTWLKDNQDPGEWESVKKMALANAIAGTPA